MFKHVAHVDRPAHFDDIGACVVMATPSMLQSGLSRCSPMFDQHLAALLIWRASGFETMTAS